MRNRRITQLFSMLTKAVAVLALLLLGITSTPVVAGADVIEHPGTDRCDTNGNGGIPRIISTLGPVSLANPPSLPWLDGGRSITRYLDVDLTSRLNGFAPPMGAVDLSETADDTTWDVFLTCVDNMVVVKNLETGLYLAEDQNHNIVAVRQPTTATLWTMEKQSDTRYSFANSDSGRYLTGGSVYNNYGATSSQYLAYTSLWEMVEPIE